jgi:hypothetical protein
MAPASSAFEDVDLIRDPDGIVGVISRRVGRNQFSLGIFKVFQRDGAEELTTYFGAKYLPAVRRVLELAEARMAKLEADHPPDVVPAQIEKRTVARRAGARR